MTALALPTTARRCGYHPLPEDAARILADLAFASALVVGHMVPDVTALVTELRVTKGKEARLPRGVFWFDDLGATRVMIVTEGVGIAPPVAVSHDELPSSDLLRRAAGWFDEFWKDATPVPQPIFALHAAVVTLPLRRDGLVTKRACNAGRWSYTINIAGKSMQFSEHNLEPLPAVDEPTEWVKQQPVDARRFAATLTRAKLAGELSDVVFSFRATKTIFKPYQFKPVIKLLETGKLRLLIADEVGLGKTIEAGLVWTELEARKRADRVLVLCPSSLVYKWRLEMETRFGFDLELLDSTGLATLERRLESNTLPPRAAYICSIEKMRMWESLDRVTELGLGFDLVVVDEAHALRNAGTASHELGQHVSDWAEALVFLSATPLNLRNADLYNLLDLLSPGEFGDVDTLESQLQPTGVLNGIARSLLDDSVTSAERVARLHTIPGLTFGSVVASRAEFQLLADLLASPTLDAGDVVRARRLITSLHALSAVINRTRKVDVQEDKAIRSAETLAIDWCDNERTFYEAFREWCVERAKLADMPLHFAMQMPLRLAGSCLPAAARHVLDWPGDLVFDEDGENGNTKGLSESMQLEPHAELVALARQLGRTDSKFDVLLPHLDKLVRLRQQALLFTFSRATLRYLVQRLSGRYRIAVLHGDVPKAARQQIMDDFRNGLYDVLLANRVASEGLDFEFCSTVINYDLPWNPMEVEQRIGRIDRFGQKAPKVYILNFHTPDTIESDILVRLMARIGVFERSIGELEPIVRASIGSLPRAVYDFQLTETERKRQSNQAMVAVEELALMRTEVESASGYLMSTDGADIETLEHDLVGRGRYVGQRELMLLVNDWLAHVGGRTHVSRDGAVLTIRGGTAAAKDVRSLAEDQQRSNHEIDELVSGLTQELDLHFSLDQEKARTGTLPLLTANHPLVRAALRVPEYRQARFASVQLSTNGSMAPGDYLVYLALARWSGLRPQNEIWSSALDLSSGASVGESIGDLLLARLADGRVDNADGHTESGVGWALDALEAQLLERRDREEVLRSQENRALLQTRRVSIREIHDRKVEQLQAAMVSPKISSNPRVLSMWEGKLRKETSRLEQLESSIADQEGCGMSLEPLAVCIVKVVM